jgi:hypothetical protein
MGCSISNIKMAPIGVLILSESSSGIPDGSRSFCKIGHKKFLFLIYYQYICEMKLKFKTLYKPSEKTFVHIDNIWGIHQTFTASTPKLMPLTATWEDLLKVYDKIDFSEYELINIEVTGEFEIE